MKRTISYSGSWGLANWSSVVETSLILCATWPSNTWLCMRILNDSGRLRKTGVGPWEEPHLWHGGPITATCRFPWERSSLSLHLMVQVFLGRFYVLVQQSGYFWHFTYFYIWLDIIKTFNCQYGCLGLHLCQKSYSFFLKVLSYLHNILGFACVNPLILYLGMWINTKKLYLYVSLCRFPDSLLSLFEVLEHQSNWTYRFWTVIIISFWLLAMNFSPAESSLKRNLFWNG